MNNICKAYCNMINKEFDDIIKSIIIYGSNIYNSSSSDLDVCLILNDIDDLKRKKIILETLSFHKYYNLKTDEEIPHENKLLYTKDEVNSTLSNPPFYKNGIVVIKDIVKSREFLSSNEMKQRLLLNILTTDHLTIGESTSEYELKAWEIMIDVITKFYNLDKSSEEEILECMYKNKLTGAEGEMYLGYKKNYLAKEKYLKRKIHEVVG